jgi:hypothetical protein
MPARHLPSPSAVLLALAAAVALMATGCRKRVPPPRVEYRFEKVIFQVAETALPVHVTQVGSNPLTMVNLHEDERN